MFTDRNHIILKLGGLALLGLFVFGNGNRGAVADAASHCAQTVGQSHQDSWADDEVDAMQSCIRGLATPR